MNHDIEVVESLVPDGFELFAKELYEGDPMWRPAGLPADYLSPAYYLVRANGSIIARACRVANVLLKPEERSTAFIGWYECVDDADVAMALLQRVCDDCRSAGFERVVGPLNGSTWHAYRFAEPTGETFFLDVHHKPWYPSQWQASGFASIANHHSTRISPPVSNDLYDGPDDDEWGISLREFRVNNFDEDLHALYDLSVAGFADNYLYAPIDFEEFAAMYRGMERLINPRFVLFAVDALGEPIAFVFAVDNLLKPRGESLIMKSAAVLPEHQGKGLGHRLLATVHHRAAAAGYSEIIHALMHDSNRSAKILGSASTVLRRYHLYGRAL